MAQMNVDNGGALAKARAFFERAEQVAATNNFEYAIDMYLEGLRLAPDALEQGHKPLRYISLVRQGNGGKKPSVVDKLKRSHARDTLQQMLNAEYLLAKDPDHLPYAEMMLKAAVAGGYKKTAEWIADLIFEANRSSDKPSIQTFLLLKDSYTKMKLFAKAVAACQWIVKLKPDEPAMADELRNLSAQLTVQRGKYEQTGQYADFRDSMKDRDKQTRLQSQERQVKTKDYRLSQLEDARRALAAEPASALNIARLASALADMQDDNADNEAIELLQKAYETNGTFNFKRQQGEIRAKQLRRKIRQTQKAVEANPENAEAKKRLEELLAQLNNVELEHYRLCVENYPTDMRFKYELGLCYMRNRQYDQAIPMLQEAQKDPKNQIAAMNNTGLCFYMKGWLTDAIDIFRNAIDIYEIKDDATAKELRYNLGRCYEQKGDHEHALELYRKLAQLDFNFKDVRHRVDKLRNTGKQSTSQ